MFLTEFFAILAVILIVSSLVLLGVFNVAAVYKRDENGRFNEKKLISGWTILGILSGFLSTTLFFVATWNIGGSIVLALLLILSPIVILAIIVLLLVFGIFGIVDGSHKNADGKREKSKLVSGILMLVAAALIILAIVALFVYFATHPIALM